MAHHYKAVNSLWRPDSPNHCVQAVCGNRAPGLHFFHSRDLHAETTGSQFGRMAYLWLLYCCICVYAKIFM